VPPIPSGGERLWRIFSDLSRRRSSGWSGPERIGWQDVEAYGRVTGDPLDPWEALAVAELDDAYLDEAYRKTD
jgi:hypothetical protein